MSKTVYVAPSVRELEEAIGPGIMSGSAVGDQSRIETAGQENDGEYYFNTNDGWRSE